MHQLIRYEDTIARAHPVFRIPNAQFISRRIINYFLHEILENRKWRRESLNYFIIGAYFVKMSYSALSYFDIRGKSETSRQTVKKTFQ